MQFLSKHAHFRSLDCQATQCSWQTLWLHAKYRVYTSPATVYTELVWPSLSFFSFFPFHLGFNLLFFSSQGTTNESRSRIYLLNPDPIVMEDWAKEMKEDEDHV